MSTHSFENKKSVPVRVLSFHFAYGKTKTAITRVRDNLKRALREGLLRKPSLKDCSKLFRTRVKLKNLRETPIEPKKLLCRTT